MTQRNPQITLLMAIKGRKLMNRPILAARPSRVLAYLAMCQS